MAFGQFCEQITNLFLFYISIKDKINHPPERQDFQKVSHNLANFIKLKEDAKAGKPFKPSRRRQKQDEDDGEDRPENYKSHSALNPKLSAAAEAANPAHRHDKPLPAIKRMQNESDRDYLRRVNRITQASIAESQFEAKYGVEVQRNAVTGEIKIKKRPTDELDVQMKAAAKARQRGELDEDGKPTAKAKKRPQELKTMSAEEKRRLVKEMVASKRAAKAAAVPKVQEFQRDEVAFGEVAHAPPTLVTPRRAKKAETVARVSSEHWAHIYSIVHNTSLTLQPGSKKSLLLHSVIDPKADEDDSDAENSDIGSPAKKSKNSAVSKVIDLKGKRKELPDTTREMIEKQQQSAIEMYRQLKKNNRINNIEI